MNFKLLKLRGWDKKGVNLGEICVEIIDSLKGGEKKKVKIRRRIFRQTRIEGNKVFKSTFYHSRGELSQPIHII